LYFDAHNHLQDAWLTAHRDQIFADLAATDVRSAVVNGTSESDWAEVAALASAHSNASGTAGIHLHPSFGLHPWDAGNRSPDWLHQLRSYLDADPRAAIGEIGLDRWILERARPDDPRLRGLRRAPIEEQTEVFLTQLTLAAERNLPTSIHCLDAFGRLFDLLRGTKRPARGFLLHAYSGPAEMVAGFVKLGAYFSFNGAFFDPRKQRLQEMYALIPGDRLLIETDAPAMRLPGDREKFPPLTAPDGSLANHPANIATAYAGLAALRDVSVESLASQVSQNFDRLFGNPGRT
jgi:TatD DNase family protein